MRSRRFLQNPYLGQPARPSRWPAIRGQLLRIGGLLLVLAAAYLLGKAR